MYTPKNTTLHREIATDKTLTKSPPRLYKITENKNKFVPTKHTPKNATIASITNHIKQVRKTEKTTTTNHNTKYTQSIGFPPFNKKISHNITYTTKGKPIITTLPASPIIATKTTPKSEKYKLPYKPSLKINQDSHTSKKQKHTKKVTFKNNQDDFPSSIPLKDDIGKCGLMWPRGNIAKSHPAANILQHFSTEGCPVNTGENWTHQMIITALEKGPHPSAKVPEAKKILLKETEIKIKATFS